MFDEYPEAAPFLAAIRETPDDPAPRLVFADWLDDHDDPRAAWLRDEEIWAWMRPDVRDPVPDLLAALLEKTSRGNTSPALLLRRLGPQAIPSIRAGTAANPTRLWWETHWLLEAVPPPKLRPVPELIKALKKKAYYDRWQAVIDLRFHGPDAAPAVAALCAVDTYDLDFTGGDHDPIGQAAIDILIALGPAAVSAIPHLYSCLSSGARNLAEDAARALEVIGPHAPDAMLAHLDQVDGHQITWGLSLLVSTHPEGIDVLLSILRGEVELSSGVEAVARYIAEDCDPAEAVGLVPELIEALQGPPDQVRDYAADVANALAAIGEPARAAVPALRAVLANAEGDAYLTGALTAALTTLGEPPPPPPPRKRSRKPKS